MFRNKRRVSFVKFFLISVFNLITIIGYAQNVGDLSKVEVDNLSDMQITSYVERIKKEGYTIEQAVSIAKTRGMSEVQAQKFLYRIRNLGSFNVVNNKGGETNEAVEFQEETSFGLTGKEKQVLSGDLTDKYGLNFFNNPNINFTPNLNIATPENYIIGAGDVLSIDLWGAAEANYEQRVSKNGAINIPRVGYINIIGLPIKAAKSKIRNSLRKIYSGIGASSTSYNKVNLAISIKEVRNVQINIIGEVKVPGSYSLSGFSTILNALYAAGGPNEIGTLRNVELFRGGVKKADFDFYKFLLNGSEEGNITVQDQDVIIVKPYENIVTIKGEVKTKGVFEMKENETVSDLLTYCSGFLSNAYKQKIVIERINGIQKEIVEIDSNNFKNAVLRDGDYIKINSVKENYKNLVSIGGAVFQPGRYQYKENLTLNELLEKAEGYTKEAFLDRGILVRTYDKTNKETISFSLKDKKNKLLLKDNDSIYIFSKEELKEKEYITINGAVNKSAKFDFMRGMQIEDLIVLAGGLKDGADVGVIDVSRRLKDGSFETISENFDVKAAQDLNGSLYSDFVLKPFDVVSVRYIKGYTKQKNVRIEGEVNYSGSYSISDKNERISDLIEQAGGLTKFAYIEGAFLSRKNNSIEDKKQLELIEGFGEKDSLTISSEAIQGKKFFKIGIDLVKILAKGGKNSKYDLILEEGDELFIPSERQTVKVEGEVLSPSLVRYERGEKLKHYIENSGGFSAKAKKSKAYVIYANGDIKTTKRFLFFKSYPKIKPGAVILVPSKPEVINRMSAQEIIAITTGLATLGVLVKNLTEKSSTTN